MGESTKSTNYRGVILSMSLFVVITIRYWLVKPNQPAVWRFFNHFWWWLGGDDEKHTLWMGDQTKHVIHMNACITYILYWYWYWYIDINWISDYGHYNRLYPKWGPSQNCADPGLVTYTQLIKEQPSIYRIIKDAYSM